MFKPHIWHKGAEPWEGQPASAGMTLHVGTALVLTDGVLAKATGATKPEFICMQEAELTQVGQMIHVERVREETVYETELSVASADIAAGEAYTIDADGENITATTGGSAEVVNYDGAEAGDKVRVRFR